MAVKRITMNELRSIIREEFEEYGKDFLGYDYPMDDEEEMVPSAQSQVGYDDADDVEEIGDGSEEHDYHMPELDSIGDDFNDLFSGFRGMGFHLNENQIARISENVTKRIIKEMCDIEKKKGKKKASGFPKNVANLYHGNDKK